MSLLRRPLLVVLGIMSFAAIVRADTLYLRNGTRVIGELVSVQGRVITF